MLRKKLVVILLMLGIVGVLVSAGTYAWFFDDEVSTGNKFQTGTIDIEIVELDKIVAEPDGHNLLKPSQVGYLIKEIKNIGNNPARIFKRVRPGESFDGPLNPNGLVEPERDTTASIVDYIDFDLIVRMPNGDAEVIIPYIPGAATNILLSDVANKWIEIGVLQPGESMLVIQSFHLRNTGDDTNWAQDDTLMFDEDFQGRQLTGVGGADGNNPDGDMFPLAFLKPIGDALP